MGKQTVVGQFLPSELRAVSGFSGVKAAAAAKSNSLVSIGIARLDERVSLARSNLNQDELQGNFKGLTYDQPSKSWVSPAGLRYTGDPSRPGIGLAHVLTHSRPNRDRDTRGKPHGVFSVSREQIFSTIDAAWKVKGMPLPKDPVAFVIAARDFGMPSVGTKGENGMKIVLTKKGGNTIKTVYPCFLPCSLN